MPRADAGCERAIHHLTVGRLGRDDPATILLTRLIREMAGKLPGRRTRMMNWSLCKSSQWMEVCSDLGSAFFSLTPFGTRRGNCPTTHGATSDCSQIGTGSSNSPRSASLQGVSAQVAEIARGCGLHSIVWRLRINASSGNLQTTRGRFLCWQSEAVPSWGDAPWLLPLTLQPTGPMRNEIENYLVTHPLMHRFSMQSPSYQGLDAD
jgi:hypothetical protein